MLVEVKPTENAMRLPIVLRTDKDRVSGTPSVMAILPTLPSWNRFHCPVFIFTWLYTEDVPIFDSLIYDSPDQLVVVTIPFSACWSEKQGEAILVATKEYVEAALEVTCEPLFRRRITGTMRQTRQIRYGNDRRRFKDKEPTIYTL